jgi:hypothetical protein
MRDNRFKLAIVLKPRQIFDQIELEPGRLSDIRLNWINQYRIVHFPEPNLQMPVTITAKNERYPIIPSQETQLGPDVWPRQRTGPSPQA